MRGQKRQRAGQPVGLVARVADNMRIRQIGALRLFGKTDLDEIVDEFDCGFAIPFAERVVIEPFQNMPLLDAAAEIFKEAMLRRRTHDKIAAGNEQLRRNGDRPRIIHHALRRLIELQQDVRGDGARNQRIGTIGFDAFRIMGQELRLDV